MLAVGGAPLRAQQAAREGQSAFSLMRPPGHHATRGHAMGFCYLNNVAIAVLDALAHGVERVAVFDFDVHHGNGTRPSCWPARAPLSSPRTLLPGTAGKTGVNAFNYPVAPMTPRQEYRQVLTQALEI